jgi:hypothetical protein
VRILCSCFSLVVAFGLLSICVGGMSGCDGKPADGTLVEGAQISEEQTAEVRAQYKKRRLDAQIKAKTSKTTRKR